MKNIVYRWVIALSVLSFLSLVVLVNINVYTVTHPPEYYKSQTQLLPSIELKYLPYCEGGESDVLVKNPRKSCLSDYPGSLARAVIPIISVLFLVLFGLIFAYKKIKKNLNRRVN